MILNRTKIASIMVVAIMVFAGALVVFSASASAQPVTESKYVTDAKGVTISQLELDRLTVDKSTLSIGTGMATATANDPVGTIKDYIIVDNYYGNLYLAPMMKRGETAHCEVWTGTDNEFPGDDYRNAYTSRLNITNAQVTYIMNQFETNIYPTETQYFGDCPSRTGSNATMGDEFGWGLDMFNTTSGKKTIIFVYNIIDENYWDNTYPYYVGGYFWSYMSNVYDRNIINIDVWDWTNRTGDQPLNPSKSYLYESTVAHEYQHLLHRYYNPTQETWLNEGCADYSEMLCGYGVPESHIANFLAEPTNSLTTWGDGDTLADYGASALFVIYLNDKFGGSATITKIVHSKYQGIAGVNDALKQAGYSSWDFNKVFKAWRIANLLDANQPGNGIYKYKSLNLADISDSPGENVLVYEQDLNEDVYGTIGSYGTLYTYVSKPSNMRTYDRLHTSLDFEGQSQSGWLSGGWYWYTDVGDNADISLQATIDLTDSESSDMHVDSHWYIEEGWDYGFVQVSTDDGVTWESLWDEDDYMTTDHQSGADEAIVDNLPGITGSQSLTWMYFDLSEYDGMVIEVRFRYMTDTSYSLPGWCIHSIEVNDVEMMDQFEPVDNTNINWYVTLILYHNNIPMGIVDMKLGMGFETVEASYLPFKLRAVTGIIMMMSPSGQADFYEGVYGAY